MAELYKEQVCRCQLSLAFHLNKVLGDCDVSREYSLAGDLQLTSCCTCLDSFALLILDYARFTC